jgi:hypothetical protein
MPDRSTYIYLKTNRIIKFFRLFSVVSEDNTDVSSVRGATIYTLVHLCYCPRYLNKSDAYPFGRSSEQPLKKLPVL